MNYSLCVLTNTGFDTIISDVSYYDAKDAIKSFDKDQYERNNPGIIVEDFDIVPEGGHSMFEYNKSDTLHYNLYCYQCGATMMYTRP